MLIVKRSLTHHLFCKVVCVFCKVVCVFLWCFMTLILKCQVVIVCVEIKADCFVFQQVLVIGLEEDNLIGRDDLNDNSRICELHFSEQQFEAKRADGRKLLRPKFC
ncbi:uncharacterized protein LOC135143181 [Zophobas morio]|uniref:uncharacterized protein LOC135143181 n=1 Tax=Zophobas morio TaxID=2755281 RepID=UPI0030836665